MRRIHRRQFGGAVLGIAGGLSRSWAWAGGAQAVDETLRSGIARRGIPCAVGMAASATKTLYAGAFGVREASGPPVTVDSIFAIASMTKAVTTVAALQLVEQGKVQLDEPVSRHLSQLANLRVLDGFDANGKAKLRPAATPVTLKHLLTHTSGFCYDSWDGDMFRYASQAKDAPGAVPPLMFEPGKRWQYGTSVDWAGRLVEKISGLSLEDYFQAKILRPLEMHDTSYNLPPSKFDRLAGPYQKQPDGSYRSNPRKQPAVSKSFNGGGGLYSTVSDYTRFMQMILGNGRGINGARILDDKTVAAMETNQIGDLTAGKMKSYRPETSADVDIQPGATEKWGLGFLINTTPYEGGRSAGSLAWAGILNTFFWIDPRRSLCATLMMQFLPFVDRDAVGLLGEFERAVYQL